MKVIMPFFKEGVHIFFSRKDITGDREKRKFKIKIELGSSFYQLSSALNDWTKNLQNVGCRETDFPDKEDCRFGEGPEVTTRVLGQLRASETQVL